MTEAEAREARDWWADRKLMGYYMQDQPWTGSLVDAILETGPRRIVELGCNVGRNLRAIRDRDANVELVGIDVNAQAVEWGRRKWGLDLRHGDASLLEADAYDLAFTVSVLDHIPDPTDAIEALVFAAPRLVLVEPWVGIEGPVESHNPYTYSWNYLTRLRDLGMAVTDRRFPISKKSIGPDYRLYKARRRAAQGGPVDEVGRGLVAVGPGSFIRDDLAATPAVEADPA